MVVVKCLRLIKAGSILTLMNCSLNPVEGYKSPALDRPSWCDQEVGQIGLIRKNGGRKEDEKVPGVHQLQTAARDEER